MKRLIFWILFFFSIKGYSQESLMVTSGDGINNFYLQGEVEAPEHSEDKQAKFWVKIKPAQGKLHQFQSKAIQGRKSRGLTRKGYKDYAYSLQLWEYDLKNRRNRILESLAYNSAGTVIDSYKDPYAEWETIVPESVADGVRSYIIVELAVKKAD